MRPGEAARAALQHSTYKANPANPNSWFHWGSVPQPVGVGPAPTPICGRRPPRRRVQGGPGAASSCPQQLGAILRLLQELPCADPATRNGPGCNDDLPGQAAATRRALGDRLRGGPRAGLPRALALAPPRRADERRVGDDLARLHRPAQAEHRRGQLRQGRGRGRSRSG